MTSGLSKNDQMLMGEAESPDIQPNSQYDQTISLEGSETGEEESEVEIPKSGEQAPKLDLKGRMQIAPPAYPLSKSPDSSMAGLSPESSKQIGADAGLRQVQNAFASSGMTGFNDYSPRPANFSPSPATSPELAQIFSLISKFTPPPVEITPHFKPFLPDLIPAIGAIDAFIKVPRPDNEQDLLGLTVLDEPTIGCSNPQILKMQLREKYGVVGGDQGDSYIGFIDDPQKNQKALESFLDSYDEISRNRAAPSISYSYKMPDIPDLMELWPEAFQKALESVPLPKADVDLTLEEYTKVICAVLGIPVKGNIIESLHVLFSLYEQFYDNLYFNPNVRGSTPNKNF